MNLSGRPPQPILVTEPDARRGARVFVGAFFATQRVGRNRVAGVGLVFRSVGGGLGAAMSVAPWIVVRVDGEVLLRTMIVERGLYGAESGPWGPEETLMLRVQPELVERPVQPPCSVTPFAFASLTISRTSASSRRAS